LQPDELPQKESNFVRIRCLKENLSEGQETEGKDLDEQTREAGTVGSAAAAVGEGREGRKEPDAG
jgi:hypothetical protein